MADLRPEQPHNDIAQQNWTLTTEALEKGADCHPLALINLLLPKMDNPSCWTPFRIPFTAKARWSNRRRFPAIVPASSTPPVPAG